MNLHRIDVAHLPADVQELPDRLWPFMWHFFRQIKPQLFFVLAVSLASAALDSLLYYFVKVVVDVISQAPDRATGLHQLVVPMAMFTVFVLILQPVLARLTTGLMANLRPAFTNLIRRQLALYMHNHSYGYFQEDFAGRLSSKVIETPSAIASIFDTLVTTLSITLMTPVVFFVLFAHAYWVYAVLTVIWLVLFGLLMRKFIPRIHRAAILSYDQSSVIRGRFVDTLTNILTVKLFARRTHEDRYLLEALKEQARRGQILMHSTNTMWIGLEVISAAFLGAVFAATIFGWAHHAVSAGTAAMALPMAIRLVHMSWWMSSVFSGLFENFGQVQEGISSITVRHSVTDVPGAKRLAVGQGGIAFDRVCFAYGERKMFEEFSLHIPPGQKVGLIGPSGAGKSTLIQLLLRLYDIQAGSIKIDGQDIKHVTQDSLREAIAVIPQSADLMHRTIRDNIRYGRLDATEAEVVVAARRAHADDFIADLVDKKGHNGYDAFAGERGVKLSGGQRQRVAIARAILKDAPILLLDEATSALDSESEKMIQDSLINLMEGKTVLAIAHRLSTVSHMDRLIVMDKGRIVEDGSHIDLLRRDGLYAKLWSLQSGGFIKA